MMRKIVIGILLLAFAIAIVLTATDYYPDSRAEKVYINAYLGQTESSIIKILGQPNEILPCGQYLWWNGDTDKPEPNNGVCVKWVRYNYFLSSWGFGYTKNGTLISRYHYVSE